MTDPLTRARNRWTGIAVIAATLFVLVYVFAVLTPAGQAFENAAFTGALQVNPVEVTDADRALDAITVASLAVGTAVIAVVGLVRGGWRLAGVGVGIIAVSLGVAEVLKRWVLPHPQLIADGTSHPSFPSGHTTIAMTVLVAVLVVVPWRWRGVAMLVVMTWAVTIGTYTLTARWHLLSDTLGGDLLALTAAALAGLVLRRFGMVRRVDGPPRRLRVVYVVLAAVTALAALAMAVILLRGIATGTDGLASPEGEWLAYCAAVALASVGSIAAALTAWASWHRVETVPRPRAVSGGRA